LIDIAKNYLKASQMAKGQVSLWKPAVWAL